MSPNETIMTLGLQKVLRFGKTMGKTYFGLSRGVGSVPKCILQKFEVGSKAQD